MTANSPFSERIARLTASPIRDILGALERPGMISFAGGLPDPESFPQLDFDTVQVGECLQYGATEGERQLREEIATRMQADGIPTEPDRILILSGSQQGIDLVAKLMIDPGTDIAIQTPTYLAALQVFSLFGARYVPLLVNETSAGFQSGTPSTLYINPTFQNPTGAVLSSAERHNIARLCDDRDIVLFEDDPYRELYYERCDRTPVCSLVKNAAWIYQSSFSKTVSPGLRIGFMTCSESLFVHLQRLKQAADLHTNRLGQALALQVLQHPDATVRLNRLRDLYRAKRDRFDLSLRRHFADLADWDTPAGGLFFWLRLKTDTPIDTRALMNQALEHKVAFMPGEAFYTEAGTDCYLRLNFSHSNEARTERGLEILAGLVASAGTRRLHQTA